MACFFARSLTLAKACPTEPYIYSCHPELSDVHEKEALESFVYPFDKESASEGVEQYSNAVMSFDLTPTSALTWPVDSGR